MKTKAKNPDTGGTASGDSLSAPPREGHGEDNPVGLPPANLRDVSWPRWLHAPEAHLVDTLYVPALGRAVRYDRCCAYFSSSVLAVAARGFGPLIQRLLTLGPAVAKPAVRLFVNEQLNPADLNALLTTGDQSALIAKLLKQFKTPTNACEKRRLEMLAWLVASGLAEVKVGLMRAARGISHAKFGVVTDAAGESLVFMGSDNETGQALCENYEELELSTSWQDQGRAEYFRGRFEVLWKDNDPHVTAVPLPEAVRQKLIKLAPAQPPTELQHDKHQLATAMLWHFIAAAPYLPNGEQACDATSMLDEIWPHQRRVVEDTARAFPAGRLLCDEVGMGKTIEAILVLRRLICGRGVKRALLLVPAGLLQQWQDELREKGGLVVPVWDNGLLLSPGQEAERVEAKAAFAEQDLLLVSREWARLDNNRALLLSAPPWDLALLDEAHAARRAKPEEGEFNTGNLLLTLLRELHLRGQARSILLLSATPMQTSPWEPWDLLSALGVGGAWMVDFSDIRAYYGSVERLKQGQSLDFPTARVIARLVAHDSEFPLPPAKVNHRDEKALEKWLAFLPAGQRPVVAEWLRRGAPLGRRMHRNTRDTLRGYFQKGLLSVPPAQRDVQDEVFDYKQKAERECYNAIENYINERYDQLETEKPGKGFLMTVYRRMAASSPRAFQGSLQRRQKRLDKYLSKHWLAAGVAPEEVGVDLRDLSDAGLDEGIDPALPTSPKAAQAEKEQLKKLLARHADLGTTDSKFDKFWSVLKNITGEGRAVLVFSEYTDTLEYLRDQLHGTYGETLACYSGPGGQVRTGQGWAKVTKADITERLAAGKVKVLVCTDAASEGLNLQAASALINYDLPWNPSKVEQRIGRIDRIGQQQTVLPIRNLFLKNSVDMAVYQALRFRCGLFEHFVGQMQPVLALARDALRRNLRATQAEAFINELDKKAAEVKGDGTLASAFAESPAQASQTSEPPVTRADIATALEWLSKSSGPVKAKHLKPAGCWRLSGLGGKAVEVALDREALERNEAALPLTVGKQGPVAVKEKLGLPSRVPLLLAEYSQGPFQCAEARWVGESGATVVGSASQLRQLIEAWNGAPPPPNKVVEAQKAGVKAARQRVSKMRLFAAEVAKANKASQLAAARLRLIKELGRTLRCVGPGDLNRILRKQIESEASSEGRYHRALNSLGGYPHWPAHLLEEIEAYVKEMSAHARAARVNLSPSLDAALNDPRWRQVLC